MQAAAVRLDRVSKRFGPKTAVDGVTFSIDVGSVHGLIGPNGAGKTTIFSMLAGYLEPSAGIVEVLGLAPKTVDRLRARLGVLPQDALLPAGDTVGEFLVDMARLQDIPAVKAEGCARQALDEVTGKDWWGQRCGSLSHGMAKRVALAQAFLGEPEVVLLDEPTAGLDPISSGEIDDLVLKLQAEHHMASIVVTHDLHSAKTIADRLALLNKGKVVIEGNFEELQKSDIEFVREFLAHS